VALEELIQDWREVGHGCVGGMGWTGDGDVWEILKVKCWEQGKFVYLWAEESTPFGVSNALEVVVAVVEFWTVHWFLAFAFAFIGSSRSSLPATSTLTWYLG